MSDKAGKVVPCRDPPPMPRPGTGRKTEAEPKHGRAGVRGGNACSPAAAWLQKLTAGFALASAGTSKNRSGAKPKGAASRLPGTVSMRVL